MFDLKDHKIIIQPEELAVPYIKSVWDADKSKDKGVAFKELSYIFYMYSHKSPYAGYPEEQRSELIRKDIMNDLKWSVPKLVQEAIVKYRERNTTLTQELLESAQGVVYKLKQYYDKVDFAKTDKFGVLIYDAKKVQDSLGNLGKVVDSVNVLTDMVKKERTQKSSVRGGKGVALFES